MSDFANPWTAVHQVPLSVEFSRQEYWRGLPFPPPGNLLNPGIEPKSPTLQAGSLPSEPPRKAIHITLLNKYIINKSLIHNFIINDYINHSIDSFQHPPAPFHSPSLCSNSGFCTSCLNCRSGLLWFFPPASSSVTCHENSSTVCAGMCIFLLHVSVTST